MNYLAYIAMYVLVTAALVAACTGAPPCKGTVHSNLSFSWCERS